MTTYVWVMGTKVIFFQIQSGDSEEGGVSSGKGKKFQGDPHFRHRPVYGEHRKVTRQIVKQCMLQVYVLIQVS